MVDTSALYDLTGAGGNEPEQELSKTAEISLLQEQDDRTAARAVYKEYAENIKKSENLRIKILKGLEAGDSTEQLLLWAAEVIYRMTGDSVFYANVKKHIEK